MTLTKRDLVTRISNETGLVQQQVLDVVQKTLDYIAEALAKGDKVEKPISEKRQEKIERKLRLIEAPTQILWATDDVYFDKKWAHWLGERISGTQRVVEVDGARLFFFEERAKWFNEQLRKHWATV